MPLTDVDCRNAVCPPSAKRRRLTDSGGLYLEVSPAGSRRWFWKFYPDGKESRMSLGSYPSVSLKTARLARDKAKAVRATGDDPVKQRKSAAQAKAADLDASFEVTAREFHAGKAAGWSPNHASQWLRCCEKDLFPWLGSTALPDITAPMLLGVLRRVQRRGAIRMAHDLREFAGQVFRHGIATGRCDRNVAADLRGALDSYTERHAPAVLDPTAVGELMRAIAGYSGQPTTRAALLVSALTFQRPVNIRTMAWAEVDLDCGLWTIPAAKMKRSVHGKVNGRPHLVPLARQAVEVLRDLQPLTGRGTLVFPGLIDHERPMSENTVNLALRRLGYGPDEMVAHGFRAMARTLLAEHTSVAPDAIEAQLAHGKSGPLGMAYDRAEFMAQRHAMMQLWADLLDSLQTTAAGRLKAAA